MNFEVELRDLNIKMWAAREAGDWELLEALRQQRDLVLADPLKLSPRKQSNE